MLYGIVWLCRWMIGPYKMLGRHQQLVLIVTAILSALVHSVTNGFTLDWTLTAHLLSGLGLTRILAWAMNNDRSATERLVYEKFDHLSDRVSQLNEDLVYKTDYLQQEVDDLEDFIRTKLADYDIVIPPRPAIHRVDASGVFHHWQVGQVGKEGGVSVGRGWKSRLRLGIRAVWRVAWTLIVGTPAWLAGKPD